MEEEEIYDLHSPFALEKGVLTFAGFYPQRKLRLLVILGAIVNLFFSVSQFISLTVQVVIDRNNMSQLSENVQFYVTHSTFMCKLFNFVINNRKLLDIEDTLRWPEFNGFSRRKFKLLESKKRDAKLAGQAFWFTIVAAMIFYALMPFLDHDNETKRLPMPGWFPYNVKNHFYPTFMFQMLAIINTAYTNSTIDILTWLLICIATGQLEILKLNLQEIDYANANLKETEEAFKKCVKHHEKIIILIDKIEDTFSRGIFLQFFASVIVICFSGFLLVILPMRSARFGYVTMYFFCMLCQIGMYCWFGHDVMTISSKIGDSFHMSNWYLSDIKLRKNVFIFLERTKQPITLTAGKIVTLSLMTLTAILRSSYSYMAVLRHMYDN